MPFVICAIECAMPARRPLAHWLLLFALVAMWGSSFVFTKIAVSAIPPASVVAGRLVLAMAVLLGVVLITRRRLPRGGRFWGFFFLMAVIGNCLPFWLITWGQQGIDSGLAGILMAVMPLTTVVLAHFFVAGEGLNGARIVGFLLGFAGIVVLTGPDALLELKGEGTVLLSELAVLGGALCYALGAILARRRPDSEAMVATTVVVLIAGLVMVPLAVVEGPPAVGDISAEVALAVAFLGLVSTATATVVYFKLITEAGPTFLSMINYLIPIWALLLGAVMLEETPEWTSLAALALILSGIVLAETRGRRARD